MRRLSIGQFSQLTRLSINALRLYADNGVLRPTHVDAETGYRFYDPDQIERAERIKLLRGIGISLNHIQRILDASAPEEQLSLLDEHALHLEEQLKQLKRFSARLRSRTPAPDAVERFMIETVPTQRIAGVRIMTGLARIGDDIRRAFETLHQNLAASPLRTVGTPMVIYHDLIDEVSDGDVEVCVPIHDSVLAHPTLTIHTLEAANVAAIVHRGPYDQITSAYQRILHQITLQGLEPVGPPREIYMNDPTITEPSARMTRIEYPVAKTDATL